MKKIVIIFFLLFLLVICLRGIAILIIKIIKDSKKIKKDRRCFYVENFFGCDEFFPEFRQEFGDGTCFYLEEERCTLSRKEVEQSRANN